jgi:hypothetical protein
MWMKISGDLREASGTEAPRATQTNLEDQPMPHFS